MNKNIIINSDVDDSETISNLLKNNEKSIETLTLKNVQIQNFELISNIFFNFNVLKSLNLVNCKIIDDTESSLTIIESLKSILFHNCNGNFIKIFKNQKSVEKLTICSYKPSFNEFAREELNNLAKNLSNLRHLVFDGDGTSSYFDLDKFPYKIEILEATAITFNWYCGIETARLVFLKSQLGVLKELTIHNLPLDFDGGKVLKFIIEKMNLEKFYYGRIPLILNGIKQEIDEFSATETQIQSTYEMFRQFRSIMKFCMIINNTDICSDAVENVIDPKNFIFVNLKEFKLIDNCKGRGLFGVFLGVYRNLTNIKKLTFDTQDRNINVILEECLPNMMKLEEICLTSTAPKASSRFETIKKLVKGLKKLTIPKDLVSTAENIFRDMIEIVGI
jgi:hypothetical protein